MTAAKPSDIISAFVIDGLIDIRARLTDRSDEEIDRAAVDRIDALLSDVPPGQRNDVDLLLGRPCAVLPKQVVMVQHIDGEQDIDAEWQYIDERPIPRITFSSDGSPTRAEVQSVDNLSMSSLPALPPGLEWSRQNAFSAIVVRRIDYDRLSAGLPDGVIEHDDWQEGHW